MDTPDGLGRGHGAAFLAYLQDPEPSLLTRCVVENPCFDATCEDRSRYYALLALLTDHDLTDVLTHLSTATEPARVRVPIEVLAHLAVRGRTDAQAALRTYVSRGLFWELALNALWRHQVTDALTDLEEVVADRLDEACQCPPPSALAPPSAVTPPAPPLDGIESLLEADPSLLVRADLEARDLPLALTLARKWVDRDDPLGGFARDCLRTHGTRRDVPDLVRLLDAALTDAVPWAEVGEMLTRLSLLAPDQALSAARLTWDRTPYSYARVGALAVLVTGPDAESVLTEALYDSDESVRRLAVAHATPAHRDVLLRVATDPLEDEDLARAARTRVLAQALAP